MNTNNNNKKTGKGCFDKFNIIDLIIIIIAIIGWIFIISGIVDFKKEQKAKEYQSTWNQTSTKHIYSTRPSRRKIDSSSSSKKSSSSYSSGSSSSSSSSGTSSSSSSSRKRTSTGSSSSKKTVDPMDHDIDTYYEDYKDEFVDEDDAWDDFEDNDDYWDDY